MTLNQKIAAKILVDLDKLKRGQLSLQELEEAITGVLERTEAGFPKKLHELTDTLVSRIYLYEQKTSPSVVSTPVEFAHHKNEGFQAMIDEVAHQLQAYIDNPT